MILGTLRSRASFVNIDREGEVSESRHRPSSKDSEAQKCQVGLSLLYPTFKVAMSVSSALPFNSPNRMKKRLGGSLERWVY